MQVKTGALTRQLAIDALTHTLQRKQHADAALDRLFAAHPELRPLDRAFVFEMVYGSLRWMLKMDWIMAHMIDRPFASLDPRVANALRVGTYQIYYMDRVPVRAAVAETVQAVKLVGAAPAASLVNAVLRRVAKKAEYFKKPDKDKETVAYLSMHHSHPQWMIERWLKHLPEERLVHCLIAHNEVPQKTLHDLQKRPNPEGAPLDHFLLKTHGVRSSWRPLRSALRLESFPNFPSCPAFQAGSYIVQDESAQLAASLVQPKSGEKVLDACASPGGKTIAVWDKSPEDVHFFLADSAKKRMLTLQENLRRLQLDNDSHFHVTHSPAGEAFPKETFDHIILDAPCSSLGVISRHPEIKWLRSPQDITQCANEQRELLKTLGKRLRPGGELVYMVCSFELEETTKQIEHFMRENSEFEKVDLRGRIHDYYRKYLVDDNELLIFSGNQDRIDGFFACVLRRKAI